MTRTLYLNEYALNVCADRKGRPYISIGGTDEVPEELVDDLTDRAAMVFDGEIIDVRGWDAEKRAAADIHDTVCDEYWRGSLRPATPAEVLAVFFPDAFEALPTSAEVETQVRLGAEVLMRRDPQMAFCTAHVTMREVLRALIPTRHGAQALASDIAPERARGCATAIR